MNRTAPQPARADRAEVRNPILGMKAFRKFATLHPTVLDALADLLHEIHTEAADRAEQSWRARKGPMAVYWRAAVYAGHIRRAIRRLPRRDPDQLALLREAA
jgi:hypothetical protein